MPIKSDKIQLNDYYLNRKCVQLPIAYLAYVDKNGLIKNLKGDIYTKMKSNNKIETFKKIEIDNTIPYYDIIKTNLILDCKDRIFDPRRAVFLIDDNLYDIWGRLIEPKHIQENHIEEIPEETIDNTPEEPQQTYEPECNIFDVDFVDLKDELNYLNLNVIGNKLFEGDLFVFDGSTIIQTDRANLNSENWIMELSFKQENIIDSFMSILCFSKNGDNVFNFLTKKYDIYVFANGQTRFVDDVGERIKKEFIKIKITSKGDIYVNDNNKINVGEIDLSECNWNFIIGGDYNTDGSINNYFIGQINKFCARTL